VSIVYEQIAVDSGQDSAGEKNLENFAVFIGIAVIRKGIMEVESIADDVMPVKPFGECTSLAE